MARNHAIASFRGDVLAEDGPAYPASHSKAEIRTVSAELTGFL